MIEIYGLTNCDSCRAARRTLSEAGVAHTFIDLRTTPPGCDTLNHWLAVLGEQALVNRRSTTWRGLDEATRRRPAAELLAAEPTLIKRPVLVEGTRVHCGGRAPDWLAFVKAP